MFLYEFELQDVSSGNSIEGVMLIYNRLYLEAQFFTSKIPRTMTVNGGTHFIRLQKCTFVIRGRIGNYLEVISARDKSLQVELDLARIKTRARSA